MQLRGPSHEDATHAIKIYTFYSRFYWVQYCYKMFTAPLCRYLEGFSLIFLIDENSMSTTN